MFDQASNTPPDHGAGPWDRLLIGAGASFCISTGAGPAPDLVLELMTEREL
jgi:hypothetical protein